MELRYENKYEYTEAMCRRAATYVYYRRVIAAISHIILIITSIIGITATIYYLAGGIEPPYHYSTYFFYALAPIAAEIAVYIKYRIMLKKEKALLNGESNEITITVENDVIKETMNGKTAGESDLFDIEKVYDSKDFILIIALSQEYFILKRDCFTEGDSEKFVPDIKARVKAIHKAAIEETKKSRKK